MRNGKSITFSGRECEQIAEILNATEPSRVRCAACGIIAVFEVAGGHDVLNMRIVGNRSLVIDIVNLTNQRKGTWTCVFNFLVRFCRECGVADIIIPTVLTKEMSNWCNKHGFTAGNSAMGLGREYRYMV